MIEIIKEVAVIVGIPIFQSIFGWSKRALEDNVITTFEWKQLTITVIRVGSVTAAGYYGLGFAGIDVPVAAAALGGFLFDKIHQAIKY